MNNNVTVTVLITAFNEEEKIERCINSIINQTYSEIEILIINDGSSDRTDEIVKQIITENPNRPFTYVNRENKGRIASLNEGISIAKGDYIAIQDADDYSLPNRIERQIEYMKQHPETDVLGTAYIREDSIRGEKYIRVYPTDDKTIKKEMCKYIPICQGSVMFRKKTVQRVGGYNDKCKDAEDLDLWLRLGKNAVFANLSKPYYVYDLTYSNSYYHQKYNKWSRNIRLYRMNRKAIKVFDLPNKYYLFPILRLAYPYIPTWVKRIARRSTSKIKEIPIIKE